MTDVNVLVIDDEELIRQNVCSKISRLSHGINYITHMAADVFAAYVKYMEIRPQIIITDICMPEGGGLNFAKKIRDEDKDTVILVLSGYDDFSYVRQAFLIGVNDYLLKPLSLIELDEKLKLHLKAFVPETKAADHGISAVDQAVKYVEGNIERPVSLTDVCELTGMSYHYFSKLFKDTKGVSFTRYVSMRKMAIARELLMNPSVRISEIAKKLGFENPNHFSRAFNKSFGKYPTQIRKEMNGETDHEN